MRAETLRAALNAQKLIVLEKVPLGTANGFSGDGG
jgi:hypothetical protein